MEGVKTLAERRKLMDELRTLRNPDGALRRKAMKHLAFRVPARAMLRALYVYVIKNGFLDGLPGFHYSMLISIYEYWIGLKMKELQSDWLAENERLAQQLLAEKPA
jgi:hypothetical protein